MKLLFILSGCLAANEALAFTVNPIMPHLKHPVGAWLNNKVSTSSTTELFIGLGGFDESIWSTLSTLEGPSICYGPQGILIGKEELEIKEYDNFDMFCDALQQTGLVLKSSQSTQTGNL